MVLERDAAERVIRRAVDLVDDRADGTGSISVEALREAASELGIDQDGLAQAIAEEQVGLLDDADSERGDAMLGPRTVAASRLVSATPEATLARSDAWLRRTRSLRRVRIGPGWADYRRRADPAAVVQRTTRAIRGTESLSRVRHVRIVAVEAGRGRTLLAVVVDLSASRSAALAGGVAVGAAGITTSVVSALAWVPWAWVGVPVAAASGVGVMAARKVWVDGVDQTLEGLLDSIAGGSAPPSTFSLLTERFIDAGTARSGRVRSRP